MDFNDLIFPAPKSSYDDKLPGLHYIEGKSTHPRTVVSELRTGRGTIRAKVEQPELLERRDSKLLVTLLQMPENLHNGIVVFFHGNAEDIGMCKSFAYVIGAELQMASICMEYQGYGIYEGKCSSDIVIKDAHRLMDHIMHDLGIEERKIILMGRSIGTGVAVEMSVKYKNVLSLVLISAFTSLCDVIRENSFTWVSKLVKERFRNLEKMHKITTPTLIIHGKEDKLIQYEHSIKLMNQCYGIVDLQLFQGMTHNTFLIELHVLSPLRAFLSRIK